MGMDWLKNMELPYRTKFSFHFSAGLQLNEVFVSFDVKL